MAPYEKEVSAFVERFYREKWREVVLVLTRRFGTGALHDIENAVQGAMVKALEAWPRDGLPINPGGWILVAARNALIDRARHGVVARDKGADVRDALYATEADHRSKYGPPWDGPLWAGPMEDEVLKMILVCCHPRLTARESVAITLRLICGLGVPEIAHSLLIGEAALAKLLSRAKAKIRDRPIPFELPVETDLAARLDRALQILYLLFNEGYAAQVGTLAIRAELCREAQRLTGLLLESRMAEQSRLWALASLMAFQAARLPARVGDDGQLLRLAEQDRALWDRDGLALGFTFLERSMCGKQRSRYHLEAAIAASHALAPSFEATDWTAILGYYDDLLVLAPSPVVALNRSVAVLMTEGPEAAIAILDGLQDQGGLARNHLLPALLGDFHRRAGRPECAAAHYRSALALTGHAPQRAFLETQMAGCSIT